MMCERQSRNSEQANGQKTRSEQSFPHRINPPVIAECVIVLSGVSMKMEALFSNERLIERGTVIIKNVCTACVMPLEKKWAGNPEKPCLTGSSLCRMVL